MGVDLALLPFDGELSDDVAFSHTVLDCFRRRELWEHIEALPDEPVPARFDTYLSHDDAWDEGTHYGNTQRTPYDTPVRCVRVADLLPLRHHQGVQDNPKNRAVWAYLAELPPDTRVALYWS